MKTNHKAILIDVTNREVKEVMVGDYKEIQKLIDCQTFTTAFHLPKGDIVYVDDEGLMNGTANFFEYKGAHQPFAGNGLICGGTPSGNSADVKIDINEVRKNVQFLNIVDVRSKLSL